MYIKYYYIQIDGEIVLGSEDCLPAEAPSNLPYPRPNEE